MPRRCVALGFVAALFLWAVPGELAAQPIEIDFKPVGCIVAGKFPKLPACFKPAAQVARARVWFWPEGNPNRWFVEHKPDAPCHSAILPKPKKVLGGKSPWKIYYAVEVVDRQLNEIRSQDYEAEVVGSEGECKKDVPVAAALPKASVAVGGPAGLPGFAGFGAASIGTTTAVVGGAVVAAGGAVGATQLGGEETPTTTLGATTTVPTTQPAATTTTTTTTTTSTTQPPRPFNAVLDAYPLRGPEPLVVTFDSCRTTGTAPFDHRVDFDGDGFHDFATSACLIRHTYTRSGHFLRFSFAPPTTAAPTPPPPVVYSNIKHCVGDQAGNVGCRLWTVQVDVATFRPVTIRTDSDAPVAPRRLAWTTQLDVRGATGQVIVNGEAASYAGAGRSGAVALGRRGLNRFEAVLVRSAGEAGTWRFELAGTPSLETGSLRVVAGEVIALTDTAVVFRLSGKPGERVVFTFRTAR